MAARRTRSPALPPADELDRLKLSPEVAWYLVTRGIPLPQPWQVPLWKTPEPRDVPGAQFNPERVDKVLRSFGLLVHTQGRWAGLPLKPDPWQVAYILAPVFGWERLDPESGTWVRIVRSVHADLPRKNGKSTTAGGVAIYLTCADGEQGAQVLAVAAAKDQAQYVFRPIKQIAESSPALKPHVKAFASKIVHPRSGSYFQVVASVGDLLHGANVHGAVIDELHVHKTRDVVDAVETGTGARTQPLIVIITTADEGRPGTIYAEKREYLEKLARGVIVDASFYGVVFAAAESEGHLRELGLDPFAEQAWKRANPGYGISPTKAFLEAEAAKAKESPASLARFLRLHLGIRTKQATRYIRLEDWDMPANAATISPAALEGRECYGGLDLASVSDITALCWLFPDRPTDTYDVLWRFWLPADALADLNRRTSGQAEVWVRNGFLETTPGAVFNTEAVSARIDTDAQKFRVLSIGYDRWGMNDVVRKAQEGGITMVGVGQGYGSLSAPLKECLRLTLVGRLRHGGNPVMRWMIDNLAVAMDPAANVKPDKAAAADKIDGVSALVTAMKECQDAELVEELPPPATASSVPETRGNFFRQGGRLKI